MKEFFYSGTVYKDSSCQAVIGKVSGVENDFRVDPLIPATEVFDIAKSKVERGLKAGQVFHIERFEQVQVNNAEK